MRRKEKRLAQGTLSAHLSVRVHRTSHPTHIAIRSGFGYTTMSMSMFNRLYYLWMKRNLYQQVRRKEKTLYIISSDLVARLVWISYRGLLVIETTIIVYFKLHEVKAKNFHNYSSLIPPLLPSIQHILLLFRKFTNFVTTIFSHQDRPPKIMFLCSLLISLIFMVIHN